MSNSRSYSLKMEYFKTILIFYVNDNKNKNRYSVNPSSLNEVTKIIASHTR